MPFTRFVSTRIVPATASFMLPVAPSGNSPCSSRRVPPCRSRPSFIVGRWNEPIETPWPFGHGIADGR
jgi:hypothetical protein